MALVLSVSRLKAAQSFTVNGDTAVVPTNLNLPGTLRAEIAQFDFLFVTNVSQLRTNLGMAITNAIDGNLSGLAEGQILFWNVATKKFTNAAPPSTNGLVTSSVTNGLATTNYVNSATNGLVTQAVTNGLATINYVDTSINSDRTNMQFDSTQFTTPNGTNVAIKSGVQATNIDANGLTNRGPTTLTGAARVAAIYFADPTNISGLWPDSFVFIGDSLTMELSPSGYGQDWPDKLMVKSNFFNHGYSPNFAVGGSTAADWVNQYYTQYVSGADSASGVLPRLSTNRWLFADMGINDVVNSSSFATLTNNVSQIWNRGKTNLFHIVAFTVPTNNNGTMSAAENQVRTNYNVWVRTNGAPYAVPPLYDFLADADLLITNATGQLVDNLHWKAAENGRLASMIDSNFPVLPSTMFWRKLNPPDALYPRTLSVSNVTYADGGLRISGGGLNGYFVNGHGIEMLEDTGVAYNQAYNRDTTNWMTYALRANELLLYGVSKGVLIQDAGASVTTNPDLGWSRLYVAGNENISGSLNVALNFTNKTLAVNEYVTLNAWTRIGPGGTTWPTGKGLEMFYDVTTGFTGQAYDRDASAWKNIQFTGQNITLYPVGSLIFDNSGAAAGRFWKATASSGAGTWSDPASIFSGLTANTFLILDGSSNVTTTNGWQVTSNSFQTMWPNQFVFIGDSLTEPQGSSGNGQEWPAKLLVKSNFWHHSQSFNLAAGATKANDWVASLYDQKVPPVAPANTNYGWLFVWLGGNDIINSATFQQVTNDVSQLWARGRTNKFKIAAFTISTNSNGTMTAAEDQVRTNFNVWVRTNSVNTDSQGRFLYDYLVDTDLFITNTTGQLVDGIHWKPSETERLAQSISTNLPILPAVRFWQRVQPPGPILADTFTATNAAYLEGGVRIGGGVTSGTFTHGAGLELTYDIAGIVSKAVFAQAYDRGATNWLPFNLRADSFNFWPTVSGVTIQDSGGLPTTNTDTSARFTVQGGKVKIIEAATFGSNSLEILHGAAVFGGNNSNAVSFIQASNSPAQLPAGYVLFNMNADGSVTNVTTTTNSLWGTGAIGSPVLTNGFFRDYGLNRDLHVWMRGNYWTGTTPGNCRFIVMLNSLTATNTLDSKLFTPTASKNYDSFYIDLDLTCRSGGASGTIEMTGTMITLSAGAPTYQNFTNSLTTVDLTTALKVELGFTNGASTDSWQPRNGGMFLQ